MRTEFELFDYNVLFILHEWKNIKVTLLNKDVQKYQNLFEAYALI